MLYDLLAGTPPFDRRDLHAAAYEEMQRIIREVEPPRPSIRIADGSRLETRRASKAVGPTEAVPAMTAASIAASAGSSPGSSTPAPGDLDWIAMKCLEKDRNRRYETASALALDIERHLRSEPVEASPPKHGLPGPEVPPAA